VKNENEQPFLIGKWNVELYLRFPRVNEKWKMEN